MQPSVHFPLAKLFSKAMPDCDLLVRVLIIIIALLVAVSIAYHPVPVGLTSFSRLLYSVNYFSIHVPKFL